MMLGRKTPGLWTRMGLGSSLEWMGLETKPETSLERHSENWSPGSMMPLLT